MVIKIQQAGSLLIARILEKPQEPAFQTVKVPPMHTPPVGSVKVTIHFFKLTVMDRPQNVDLSPSSYLSVTDLPTQVISISTFESARKQIESVMDKVKLLTDRNSASL